MKKLSLSPKEAFSDNYIMSPSQMELRSRFTKFYNQKLTPKQRNYARNLARDKLSNHYETIKTKVDKKLETMNDLKVFPESINRIRANSLYKSATKKTTLRKFPYYYKEAKNQVLENKAATTNKFFQSKDRTELLKELNQKLVLKIPEKKQEPQDYFAPEPEPKPKDPMKKINKLIKAYITDFKLSKYSHF